MRQKKGVCGPDDSGHSRSRTLRGGSVADRGLMEMGYIRQLEIGPWPRKWTRSKDTNPVKFGFLFFL